MSTRRISMRHLPKASLLRAISAVLLVIITLLGNPGSSAATPGSMQGSRALFVDTELQGTVQPQINGRILRSRFVTVNLAPFADPRGDSNSTVELNLFDDASFTAVRDDLSVNSDGSVTWSGRLQNVPYSQVLLVVGNDILVGSVTMPTAEYEVSYAGSGVHAVYKINPQGVPEHPEPLQVPVAEGGPVSLPEHSPGTHIRIDVMIVWTPAARVAAGGTSAITNMINLAVARTNTAYANSGVDQRIRAVYLTEVSYTESSTQETDLSRLSNTNDGYMDNVHALRNQYGADLVSLVLNNSEGGTICGRAYQPIRPPTANDAVNGFSVVHWSCLGGLTLAHELGHNMGSAHDRAHTPIQGSYSYSYGYQDPIGAFHTVMSYWQGCPSPCPQIAYFSNPNVYYNGRPTGVNEYASNSAHNALSLNNTAAVIAAYRASTQSCPMQPDISNVNSAVRMPTEGELMPMSAGAINPEWGAPAPPGPGNVSPMSRVVPGQSIAPALEIGKPGGTRRDLPQAPEGVNEGAGSYGFMYKIATTYNQTGGTGQMFYDVPTARWYGPLFGQSGGTIAQAPAVSEYQGQFQVLGLGYDGQIYQAFYNPPPDNRWYGWFRLSVPSPYNSNFTSAPAIGIYRGQFHIYARGSDAAIWQAFYDWNSRRWYGWNRMNDSYGYAIRSKSAPAIASYTGNNDRNELNLFYIDYNNPGDLMQMVYNSGGSNSWSNPFRLAYGSLESAPSATQYLNQLHVWLVSGSALNYAYFVPGIGWSSTTLSSTAGSAPAITQYQNQLQVFYVDGTVAGGWSGRQKFYVPGTGWLEGCPFNNMASAPSVASYLGQFQVWWRHFATP